jgi:glycosyltransferase 2 family protein
VGPGTRTALRLSGGAVIIAVVVWRVGTGPFVDGVRAIGPGTLLAAVAIGAVTTVGAAQRWRVVARTLGIDLPLRAATAAYYRSQILNSALPGGVLGDVHRGVRNGVDSGDLGRGVRAVVWERAAGQVVQAAVAVAVLLVLPSPVRGAVPAVALGVAALAVVLLLAGRGLVRRASARVTRATGRVAVEARDALLGPSAWPAVLVTSLLVVGGYLATFLLAASAVGVHASTMELLPLALVVLLAAGIPFNIGGWGPREGVAAWVFAAGGLGAGAGAATATAFGVLTLAAVLPGAVVLLLDRRPSRRHDPVLLPARAREDGALHG